MNETAELSYAEIEIDTARRLISVEMTGPLTDEALVSLSNRLRPLPEFQAGFSILCDATRVSKTKLSSDAIFRLAQGVQSDVNRRAIVVSDQVAYGMARMFELCANRDTDHVAVFSDVEAALVWILGESATA